MTRGCGYVSRWGYDENRFLSLCRTTGLQNVFIYG
jgi:hypothetical protein